MVSRPEAADHGEPLQRAFRDIHALETQVLFNPDIASESWSRTRLGLENSLRKPGP